MKNIKKFGSFINESKQGKIYKTTIQIDILSQEKIDIPQEVSLGALSNSIDEDENLINYTIVPKNKILTGKDAADEMKKQGKKPKTFQMDDDGNEIE